MPRRQAGALALALALAALPGCSSRDDGAEPNVTQDPAEARAARAEAAAETARSWTSAGLEMAGWVASGVADLARTYGPKAAAATRDFVLAAGRFTRDRVAPVAAGVMVGTLRGIGDATGLTSDEAERLEGSLDTLGQMPIEVDGKEGSLDQLAPGVLTRTAGAGAAEAAGDQAAGALLTYADDQLLEEIRIAGLGGSLAGLARGEGEISPLAALRIRRALDSRKRWRAEAARGEVTPPTWVSELDAAVRAARR